MRGSERRRPDRQQRDPPPRVPGSFLPRRRARAPSRRAPSHPGVQLLVDDADRAPRSGSRGYDFSADPFDPTRPCNDPADPWSANCAIPNLLFDDLGRFRARYPEFAVVDSGMSEFFVQFNSGGVTATVPYLPLPGARCTLSMSSTACSSPSRPVCSRASAGWCYGAFSRQSGHPVAGSAPARS